MGCLYRFRLHADQDVLVKFIIWHPSMRGSVPDPRAIGREGAVIVLFGEIVQQLRQTGGDVHRKSVAGEERGG